MIGLAVFGLFILALLALVLLAFFVREGLKREKYFCHACRTQNRVGARKCSKCGAELEYGKQKPLQVPNVFCQKCGRQARPGAKHCVTCGEKL